MAKRQPKYDELRQRGFTPLEAREFSILPYSDPVLRLLIRDRAERRARFESLATIKVARGRWNPQMVSDKWIENLSRMYSTNHWRVREGARGAQRAMRKDSPNCWAMYRSALKVAPPKGYVSPWQLRQVRRGKTKLEKGLIFIQQVERRGGVSVETVQRWIEQKDRTIKGARGQRKAQLIIERNRLERLLK